MHGLYTLRLWITAVLHRLYRYMVDNGALPRYNRTVPSERNRGGRVAAESTQNSRTTAKKREKKLLMKRIVATICAAAMALSLAACSNTDSSSSAAEESSSASTSSSAATGESAGSDFDNSQKISVVTREDGSGTRGAFIELTGVETDEGDMTTVDAQQANSTNNVMTSVAAEEGAIGYISLGSLNETVKGIAVDGVEPPSKTSRTAATPSPVPSTSSPTATSPAWTRSLRTSSAT